MQWQWTLGVTLTVRGVGAPDANKCYIHATDRNSPLPLPIREYRRNEQELESASIVDKLLPGYREKRKEAALLAARFIGAAEEMERTQSQLNQLEQQRRTFEQWQTSPKTREMERLRDYLNTKEAKTRLREIKEQQRELERQQKPSREQGWGLHL